MPEYDIGGKKYIQRPLVLGQMLQISEVLKGVKTLPVNPAEALRALGDKMPKALAIVLTEEGQSIKDKDLEAISKEISFSIDMDTMFKVIEDFFVCNPISLNLDKFTGAMQRISEKAKTGFKSSSSSSREETSPAETKSSGDTPSENVSPSPGT